MGVALSSQDLHAELERALSAGRSVAACTVMETHGSSPRGAGAKMLIFEDGRMLGTIGGGCIESEVSDRAREALRNATSGLFSFSLAGDPEKDDAMICGGTMKVLIDVWKP